MSTLRARVINGRLLVDEPTSLPEGTVLELVVDDEDDELDPEERRLLNAAISKAWESVKAGRIRPANAIIDELRTRR